MGDESVANFFVVSIICILEELSTGVFTVSTGAAVFSSALLQLIVKTDTTKTNKDILNKFLILYNFGLKIKLELFFEFPIKLV
jgi:hypothetical protein